MFICYYLASVLMLSDGTNANPLTGLHNFHVSPGPYLQARDARGNAIWYELDVSETDFNVDEVLQRCDVRAHDPQKHP